MIRRLGLASQVAEGIRDNNNTSTSNEASTSVDVALPLQLATSSIY